MPVIAGRLVSYSIDFDPKRCSCFVCHEETLENFANDTQKNAFYLILITKTLADQIQASIGN